MLSEDSLTVPNNQSDAHKGYEKQSQAFRSLQVIRWVTVPQSAGRRSGPSHPITQTLTLRFKATTWKTQRNVFPRSENKETAFKLFCRIEALEMKTVGN